MSKDSVFFRLLDRRYSSVLRWLLTHRKAVAGLAVLVLLSSVPLFAVVKKNFLPKDDMSEFEVGLRAPEGTSLEATELIANRIAARIRQIPDVAYTLVSIADDASRTSNLGSVYVRLKPLGERTRDQFRVMNEVRGLRENTHDLRVGIRPVALFGGGGNQNAEIQFTISGPDLKALERYGPAVADAARKQPGIVDVDTSMNVGKPEVSVHIDRLKAADLGVQISDAAEALRLLVGGDEVTTYNEGGEQYEVHVRAMQADRESLTAIGQLTVPSSRVGSVPLDNLARLTPGTAPAEINRLNRQRQVTIFAGLMPAVSQTPAMAAIQNAAESLKMGPGYNTRFAGRSKELGRAAQNFLLASVLSLVFMYLILAAQSESRLHPITLRLSLPLTLPFALLSIIIAGQSLNIFSALGLLVLFGVVKKNSILQIDHANQLRERGRYRDEAVLQASRDQLRPILMTTLAFVAGMVLLVLSSGAGAATNRAIGFVIIGGQTLLLPLTLVVTPVAYSLFDDLSRVRLWKWGRATGAAAATASLLLLPARAVAQIAPPSIQQPSAPAQLMRLTRDEAVRMAVDNNPELAVVRFEPAANDARVAAARAVFVPTFSSSVLRNRDMAPSANLFGGERSTETAFWSGTAGLAQQLPRGGTSYDISYTTARTTTTSPFTSFLPSLTSSMQAVVSQPLMRNFKIDFARAQLDVTRRNREIADVQVRDRGAQVVASAEAAYWALVAARAAVAVQQRSLDLSLELERTNRARVDVGQSPPLDLVAARAEVAQRRESLIVARTQVLQAEDALRTLVIDPKREDYWRVRLEPADTAPPMAPMPDVDAAVRRALEQRADLVTVRKQIQNADTNVALAKNQTMPDLRAQATYLTRGQGGSRLIREGGFPGTIVGTRDTSLASVVGQVLTSDFPTWSVGLTLSYPIGNSVEEANLARARIERDQAAARVRSLELEVVRQVREAALRLEQNQQRIETTRLARELAEQRVDAERKRFEVGMSTSFLVIQAQRDLAVARDNELRAMLDYQLAVVTFEAVQQTGTPIR